MKRKHIDERGPENGKEDRGSDCQVRQGDWPFAKKGPEKGQQQKAGDNDRRAAGQIITGGGQVEGGKVR
jgi:hypothetical protein